MITTDLDRAIPRTALPPHVEDLTPSTGMVLKNYGIRLAGRVAVGLHRTLGSRAGGRLGILTYHRVSPHVPGLPAPLCNVTPQRFREHLETLLTAGFVFRPLTEVLEMRARGEVPSPNSLVLTFDDGFAGVFEHAWPIMRTLGVPGTIFVSTAFLDEETAFPFDSWGLAFEHLAPPDSFRPLTTWQCREMLRSGVVDIGCHTHTHADFRGQPEAFRADLQRSVEVVRELFDRKIVTFAYPFGSPRLGFAGDDLVAAAKLTDAACA